MKAKVIHILCEGQTEQGFVEEVLRPYLQSNGVTGVKSILITTDKKKNARGGMLTYNHVVTDLNLLQQTKLDGNYERHIFLQRCLTCTLFPMIFLVLQQEKRFKTHI